MTACPKADQPAPRLGFPSLRYKLPAGIPLGPTQRPIPIHCQCASPLPDVTDYRILWPVATDSASDYPDQARPAAGPPVKPACLERFVAHHGVDPVQTDYLQLTVYRLPPHHSRTGRPSAARLPFPALPVAAHRCSQCCWAARTVDSVLLANVFDALMPCQSTARAAGSATVQLPRSVWVLPPAG